MVKKQRLGFLFAWNALLSLGLLWLIITVSGQIHRAKHNGHRDVGNPVPPFQPTERQLIASLDTLHHFPGNIRTRILNHRDYQLKLPVEKGWVVTLWNNDKALHSAIMSTNGEYNYPLELHYGTNRIRIGVWNGAQRLVFADELRITYHHPLVERLRYSVERGNTKRAQISFTFDGGSVRDGAEEILAILSQKGIRSTMFLTGQFIEKYPDLVLEMIARGHEIGNHTYNHPHLTTYAETHTQRLAPGVDRKFVQQQLLKTDSLFFRLTGKHLAHYWRAPYGEYNQEILDWAAEIGYQHIRWTRGFDTLDWVQDPQSELFRNPQEIYDTIVSRDNDAVNGAIVLMHLGTHRKKASPHSFLPQLIDTLRQRHFRIVSITELLQP